MQRVVLPAERAQRRAEIHIGRARKAGVELVCALLQNALQRKRSVGLFRCLERVVVCLSTFLIFLVLRRGEQRSRRALDIIFHRRELRADRIQRIGEKVSDRDLPRLLSCLQLRAHLVAELVVSECRRCVVLRVLPVYRMVVYIRFERTRSLFFHRLRCVFVYGHIEVLECLHARWARK